MRPRPIPFVTPIPLRLACFVEVILATVMRCARLGSLLVLLVSCGDAPALASWTSAVTETPHSSAGAGDTTAGSTTAASSDTSTGTGSDHSGSSTAEGTVASMSASGTESTTTGSSTGEPAGPVCGDRIVTDDEECDDGNAQDDDACRNDCTRRWIVFLTSKPGVQSDFNGITGADYECRHRATNMFLPNGERYMAWVSTSTVQPVDRMYHARGPYVLVNGLQVAGNWDALTSGTLEHPINVTEKSETLVAGVWTGTDITGHRIPGSQHCSDWTYNDSDQYGWLADSTAIDAFWTHAVETPCGATAALYCFEQP